MIGKYEIKVKIIGFVSGPYNPFVITEDINKKIYLRLEKELINLK